MVESEFYEWKRLASERINTETSGMSIAEELMYWRAKEAGRVDLYKSWRKGTAIGSHWNDDLEPWEEVGKAWQLLSQVPEQEDVPTR